MNLNNYEQMLLKILLIDFSGILLSQMLSLDWLSSFLFYLLFPLTWGLWILNIPSKWMKLDVVIVLTSVLAIVCTVVNWVQMKGPLSFSYFKKVIFFVTALLFLQFCAHRKLKEEETDWIYRWSEIVSWMFPVMFFLQGTNRYFINGKVSRYLTLDFSNPNFLSLFLTCLIVIESTAFFREKLRSTWKTRAFRLVCLLYLVIETQARNAELVLCAYALCFGFLYVSQKKSYSWNKWSAAFIGCFPILFFSAYMLLIENPVVQGMFGFLAGIGKKLNSRVKMWTGAWEHFIESPLIGAYYQISEGTGFAQMHNTHLDTAASYGIVVMILLCVIFSALFITRKEFQDKRRFCCTIAFAAILLLGMGETATLVGSLGIFVLMGLPLLLANAEMNEADLNAQGESVSEIKNRIQSSAFYLKALECFKSVQIQLKRIKVKK